MKIHEYQARVLLERCGVPVPAAVVIEQAHEAGPAFDQLQTKHGVDLAVIKAQVHAGGRGKGGGVKLVRSADEAHAAANRALEEYFQKRSERPQKAASHLVVP